MIFIIFRYLMLLVIFRAVILLLTFQGDPLNARLLTALFSAAIFIFAVYTLSKLDTTPSLPVRILKVLFTMHGVLMMSQALVIGMDWLGLNQANTGFVLQLILVNHILLATATTLALPLLAFTHSEQRLRVMAERDGLTGLYNRRSLFREGIRAFDQATQSQTQLAVLMLDLDHFKQVHQVSEHIMARWYKRRFTVLCLADLMKNPRIANAAPANHQASSTGVCQNGLRLFSGINVAVGKHGTGQCVDGMRDIIVMHSAPVAFVHGATMDG
jgi:predicted signal transduction protein with EAL and GGDEF domain